MIRTFCFLLMLFSFSFTGKSQQNSIFELQGGISYLQIPSRVIQYNGLFNLDPSVGFRIGALKSWNMNNYFFLRTGLIFEKSGIHGHSQWEYKVNLRTNSICLPVNAGFLLAQGDYQPSIYFGIRPSLNISNSITREAEQMDFNESGDHRNLFNHYVIGFSMQFGKHFLIDANYAYGNNYYFMEGNIYPMTQYSKPIHSIYSIEPFRSGDFSFSVFYKFYKKNIQAGVSSF